MTLCTPWVTGADLAAQRPDIVSTIGVAVSGDPATAAPYDVAAEAASEVLFALSGRRFPGLCRVTLRPTARPRTWSVRDWSIYLSSITGTTYSASWGFCLGDDHGGCGSGLGVANRKAIDLGVGVIADVVSVTVDGQVLPPTAYETADGGRVLIRTDGGRWPTCQDWTLPSTEPGTFEVVCDVGADVPAAGKMGAVALAAEYAKSAAGKDSQLPSQVTRVVRQGVEWGYFDPVQVFKNGLTGIPLADAFIVAFNPHRQKSRPRVLSPDTIRSHSRGQVAQGGGWATVQSGGNDAYTFSGIGPPPDNIPGAVAGDTYLDTTTGNVYALT